MIDSHDHIDDDVARLIQVSFGSESRPDPDARAQMFRRLASDVRGRERVTVLPEWMVVTLVGFLVLLAFWLVLQNKQAAMLIELNSIYLVAAFVLFLNLVFIPIATIIIMIRRRYV